MSSFGQVVLVCAALSASRNFQDYVDLVRDMTSFERPELEGCRAVICSTSALWGRENPDISGIGVATGYAAETGLSFLFAILTYYYHLQQRQRRRRRRQQPQATNQAEERWWRAVHRNFESFFECAIYFSIAIQLASIVVLAKRDFGVAPDGFGASETHIYARRVCPLRPALLIPAVMLPRYHHSNQNIDGPGNRATLHKFLFSLVILLFFNPFLSQGIHIWAPTRIGQEGGIIDDKEWDSLNTICMGQTQQLSDRQKWALGILQMIASLLIYVYAFWVFAGNTGNMPGRLLGLKRKAQHQQWPLWLEPTTSGRGWVRRRIMTAAEVFLLTLPFVLGIALLCFVFELRRIQQELTVDLGQQY
ncbi:hypothetical protein B0H66DRAFT_530773 [Apodospora peruviana]|uniref:Uncharacterized protein n=1 Tax=Apodospora peruviana TaxID=516989 RepID=A0AAE0IKG9_9PEZI|nr:hypothetical protein B0H66DRAFT_530773 [Apodospora peruviana]